MNGSFKIYISLLRKNFKTFFVHSSFLSFLCLFFVSFTVVPSAQAQSPQLKISGNEVVNASSGCTVQLKGVDLSGLEYSPTGDTGSGYPTTVVDGTTMTNYVAIITEAINVWHANCIRLPMNQDFWFGGCGNSKASGENQTAYKDMIQAVVNYCSSNNAYVDLDLHWSGTSAVTTAPCGSGWGTATGQEPMPDMNAVTFWSSVASTYANNSAVMFDLYNEPYDPSGDDTTFWDVWRNGGSTGSAPATTPGLQALLTAVRNAGANNIVVAGGLNWAFDLRGVVGQETGSTTAYALTDTGSGYGVLYSSHCYSSKGYTVGSGWDPYVTIATSTVPVIIEEFGAQSSDPAGWDSSAISWIEGNNDKSYVYGGMAWSFTPDDSPDLLTSYTGFTTTSYHGAPVSTWLADLYETPTPNCSSGGSTPTFTFTPTSTFTKTSTPSLTNTPSNTPSSTTTLTRTNSPTPTPSYTATSTASKTVTPTVTNTTTSTATLTKTATATSTPSFTTTNTPVSTATQTATATATRTATTTTTNTASNSPTNTSSFTPTQTSTNTSTHTSTATATVTPVNTATQTVTATTTGTASATATNTTTRTPTGTPTNTFVETGTNTAISTPTGTATSTATNTSTSTATNSATKTATNTTTHTPTNTSTQTPSNSPTSTPTGTPTNTFVETATNTATSTPTGTATSTVTNTSTSTATNSATKTVTSTVTNTSTNSATNTITNTTTNTPTQTSSNSPTSTPSVTLTGTPTNTFAETATNTATSTPTGTATSTSTNTSTSTVTNTATKTVTNTVTNSSTNTITNTVTNTPTNTPTQTSSNSPTSTPSVTLTGTPTNTFAETATKTASNTPSNTVTSTTSFTPTSTSSLTATSTASYSPTKTQIYTTTSTTTSTATLTLTITPTFSPTPVTVAASQGSNPPGNSTQVQGASGVTIQQIQMNNPSGGAVTITSITIFETGVPPAGITSLDLFANGTLIGTASFNGSTATFNFNSVIPGDNGAVTYEVTVNFSPGSSTGSYEFSATGAAGSNGEALLFSGIPVAGATVTLAAATATETPTSTTTPVATGTFTSLPTATTTKTATPSAKPTVVVYPNPATGGTVQLNPDLTSESNVSIEIFTIAFRKVNTLNYSNIQPGESVPIPLSDSWGTPLASGLYYVVVQTNQGRSVVKLLILH